MNLIDHILALTIFILVDYIYLSSVSGFFNKLVKKVQGTTIKLRYEGAIMCYILLYFGLYHFVLRNPKKKLKDRLIDAFVLGLVIYGVYETTNYAILKNWDINAVIIDTFWGGCLYAITTYIVTN